MVTVASVASSKKRAPESKLSTERLRSIVVVPEIVPANGIPLPLIEDLPQQRPGLCGSYFRFRADANVAIPTGTSFLGRKSKNPGERRGPLNKWRRGPRTRLFLPGATITTLQRERGHSPKLSPKRSSYHSLWPSPELGYDLVPNFPLTVAGGGGAPSAESELLYQGVMRTLRPKHQINLAPPYFPVVSFLDDLVITARLWWHAKEPPLPDLVAWDGHKSYCA